MPNNPSLKPHENKSTATSHDPCPSQIYDVTLSKSDGLHDTSAYTMVHLTSGEHKSDVINHWCKRCVEINDTDYETNLFEGKIAGGFEIRKPFW